MPYVDEDSSYMITALRDAGTAIADCIVSVEPESPAASDWVKLTQGNMEPEEFVAELIAAGERLSSVGQDWVKNSALDSDLRDQLAEALDTWNEVACDPKDLGGKTPEEGGPAYY